MLDWGSLPVWTLCPPQSSMIFNLCWLPMPRFRICHCFLSSKFIFFKVLPFHDWLVFSNKWILIKIFLNLFLLFVVIQLHWGVCLLISQTGSCIWTAKSLPHCYSPCLFLKEWDLYLIKDSPIRGALSVQRSRGREKERFLHIKVTFCQISGLVICVAQWTMQ